MKNVFNDIYLAKGYKYLVLKIVIFISIAFIADLIIGKFFNYFYFKQSSGWEYRTKYSIEDTKENILIFGASRAQQQYNPVYFEERLHQSAYNVGRDGEPIFYYYSVLQAVLARYAPKIIILDIENGVFRKSQDSYDRLSVLLPYYKSHPELRSIIKLRSSFEKWKLLSHIYPYNSLLFKIAIGNTKFNKKRNEDIKGYVPLSGSLDGPIRTVDLSEKYDIDSNKVNFFKLFIEDCNKAKVKLYIVCSPYFFKPVGADQSMVLAKEIAGRKKIDFMDFSKDETFLNNPKLFDDTVHVNMEGSKTFSNKVIDSIILKNANH